MKDGCGTYCVLCIASSADLVCSIPLSRIVDTSEVKGKGRERCNSTVVWVKYFTCSRWCRCQRALPVCRPSFFFSLLM